MELLHWQNLVFLIPLAVGLIFALGTAAGIGGDHDHDLDADHDLDLDHDVEVGHDVETDHDADAGHDTDSDHGQAAAKGNPLDAVRKTRYRDPAWLKALGIIGVGKAPFTVVLTVLTLMFGGIGVAGNLTVGRSWFWLTFAAALVGAILIGGRISSAVGKIVPKTETYCPGSNDLVGLFGTVIMTVDQRFGQVHVRDSYGNLHKVLCEATDGETIPKGRQVVLVSYDQEKRRYLVAEAQLEQTA